MEYYAWMIHNPNNTAPSDKFQSEGYLDADEAEELRRQALGSDVQLVEFESQEHYEKHLQDIDAQYFEEFADMMIDHAGAWM